MFRNFEFKMKFGLTIIDRIGATTRNILWWLVLKDEKVFDQNRWLMKTIFRLQDVSLRAFFEAFFDFETKNLPRTKTSLLGTFLTIILSVHKLLRYDVIHESIKCRGYFFLRIVFKWSISKRIVLKL